MSDGLMTVERVARDLGIGAAAVRNWIADQGRERVDYMKNGRAVLFTPGGWEKISTWAGASVAQEGAGAANAVAFREGNGADHTRTPVCEDLRVTRPDLSPRMVLAVRPNGNEVTVLVKSAALLKPGMVLQECMPDSNGWSYQGRLPRTLGEQQLFFQK